jgi:hypothetical protein
MKREQYDGAKTNDLKVEIMAAMNHERVTLEILVAALGVLEGVTDATFNPGGPLMPVYEAGRNLGAGLPGGVDVDEESAGTGFTGALDFRATDGSHLEYNMEDGRVAVVWGDGYLHVFASAEDYADEVIDPVEVIPARRQRQHYATEAAYEHAQAEAEALRARIREAREAAPAATPAEVGDKIAASIVGDVVEAAEDGAGSYIGNADDGVWFAVAEGPDGKWYMSAIVDCDTAGFSDSLTIDEPYDDHGAAWDAGLNLARTWCEENSVRWREPKHVGVEELIDYLKGDEEHLGVEWEAHREVWRGHMQRERELRLELLGLAQAAMLNVRSALEGSGYPIEEEASAVDDFFAYLISRARNQGDA